MTWSRVVGQEMRRDTVTSRPWTEWSGRSEVSGLGRAACCTELQQSLSHRLAPVYSVTSAGSDETRWKRIDDMRCQRQLNVQTTPSRVRQYNRADGIRTDLSYTATRTSSLIYLSLHNSNDLLVLIFIPALASNCSLIIV